MNFRDKLIFVIYLTLSILFGSGCVSVSLPKSQAKKSDRLVFGYQPKSFEIQDQQNVDVAWKNTSNGSIISALSECDSGIDPTLESLKSEVLSGLEQEEVLLDKKVQAFEREGLRYAVRGKVDGAAFLVDLLIVKRDGCSFVMSYVVNPKTYPQEVNEFEKWLNSMRLK